MRTNIVIDDELMENARKATGLKTKKEVVDAGLKLLIQEKSKIDLRTLRGKFEFAEDYDYKEFRKGFTRDFG